MSPQIPPPMSPDQMLMQLAMGKWVSKALSLVADLSIVHAYLGDTEGNLVYRKTARNFNPMMATAGKMTIAEVEHLVQPGDINPDHIITPGVFVKRLIHVPNAVKHIEQRTVRKRDRAAAPAGTGEEV